MAIDGFVRKIAQKFIQIPANLEEPQVLKRFAEDLVGKLEANPLVALPIMYPKGFESVPVPSDLEPFINYASAFVDAQGRLTTLNADIRTYVFDNLESQILTNTDNIASVTQQFGDFYDTATAAAWWGISIKAGEVITGITIGAVDTDTTTPGSGGSVFAINADSFQIARSVADITDPDELAYLTATGLDYATLYDADLEEIVPAFLIEWNGSSYDIFFNGTVSFLNVSDLDEVANAINNNVTTINGGKITTNTITATQIAANTITASEIAASTITADRMNVTTLSSISANIGTITAGTINADVVNAGVLNLAQVPDITIESLNTLTNTVTTITDAPLISVSHTSDGTTRIRKITFIAVFDDSYDENLYFYRGTTLIWTAPVNIPDGGYTFSLTISDSTSGNHTYSVESDHNFGSPENNAYVSSRQIHVIESKK